MQVDHQGNVYVADRGNNRYVVLDNNLKWKTAYTQYGTAWSDCISEGPHQYLFMSNSNPNGNSPGSWAKTGQIYKAELDGTPRRQVRPCRQAGARLPGGSHDGLPQSQPDHRGRDRILAHAEIRPEGEQVTNEDVIATLLLAAAGILVAVPPRRRKSAITTSQPLTLPHDTFFGMAAGVATNSKGDVFVYTRNGEPTVTLAGSRTFAHGGSSLYEFGPDGKFVRQIGKQVYGFLAAQQVRVDSSDNIWVVDRYSSHGDQARSRRAGWRCCWAASRNRWTCRPRRDTGRGTPPGSGASQRSVPVAHRCGLGCAGQYLRR